MTTGIIQEHIADLLGEHHIAVNIVQACCHECGIVRERDCGKLALQLVGKPCKKLFIRLPPFLATRSFPPAVNDSMRNSATRSMSALQQKEKDIVL